MEELLNKLIEKGWKPYNLNTIEKAEKRTEFWFTFTTIYKEKSDVFTIRELVSRESGLWQFVCENGMTKKMEKNPRGIWINSWAKSAYEKYPVFTMEKAEYRIIESALTDEDKLEDFLLSNIRIDG